MLDDENVSDITLALADSSTAGLQAVANPRRSPNHRGESLLDDFRDRDVSFHRASLLLAGANRSYTACQGRRSDWYPKTRDR